jgi:hypothetical protein
MVLFFVIRSRAASIVAAVEAVVMMVVMVAVSRRHHDDARRIPAIGVMMVVMVVVTADADDDLGQLDIRVRRLGRSRFVDGLQQRCGIRDRFEQVSEGIRPQHVARRRSWRRRGLRRAESSERCYRSQKSSYLLTHKFSFQ